MHVFLVSTSYPENAQDWRGVFMKNLVASLASRDSISLSLWSPPGEKPDRIRYVPLPDESVWLKGMMLSGGIAHILRTRRVKSLGTVVTLIYLLRKACVRNADADVVHVNWLQNALPLWGLRVPAVVSVLGSDYGLLKVPGITHLLRMVLSQRKCVLTPNATWMVPELEKRFGDIAEVVCIPFGVDDRWFAVKRTDLTSKPRKWLAISRITQNKIGWLFSWGEGVFGGDDELHLLGPMQENVALPGWVRYHGPAAPDRLRDEWFPHAAGLVTLSRHDEGRPQVMLEAMASGLPVIASDIPAHGNVVAHGKTGWLVSSREDLREGLSWLAGPENNARAGRAARQWIKSEIGTWDDCAGRYVAAYESVLRR